MIILMSKRILKTSFFMVSGILNVLTVCAQKLPGTQEKSVALPSTVKIDGIADEWNNQFQAFNKSTDVYYTMANDKDNLYLVVQATDPVIIKKIVGGGITLTVYASGKKNEVNPLSVTFPLIASDLHSGINVSYNDLAASKTNKDSVLNALNKKLTAAEKEIKVKGFKSINDSLMSVYNDMGIKTATVFNNKNALTYELMIPLKLTGMVSGTQIAYNIRLNSITSIRPRPAAGHSGVMVATISRALTTNNSDIDILQNDTDFWGKYLITN